MVKQFRHGNSALSQIKVNFEFITISNLLSNVLKIFIYCRQMNIYKKPEFR